MPQAISLSQISDSNPPTADVSPVPIHATDSQSMPSYQRHGGKAPTSPHNRTRTTQYRASEQYLDDMDESPQVPQDIDIEKLTFDLDPAFNHLYPQIKHLLTQFKSLHPHHKNDVGTFPSYQAVLTPASLPVSGVLVDKNTNSGGAVRVCRPVPIISQLQWRKYSM